MVSSRCWPQLGQVTIDCSMTSLTDLRAPHWYTLLDYLGLSSKIGICRTSFLEEQCTPIGYP